MFMIRVSSASTKQPSSDEEPFESWRNGETGTDRQLGGQRQTETETETEIETDRQTHKQSDRRTDRRPNRQTDRQTDRQTS